MEGADNSKRNFKRGSNSQISMSDTESATSQVDSWHSPLRSEAALRPDDPYDDSGEKNSKALVLVDKYHSDNPTSENIDIPVRNDGPPENPDIPAKGALGVNKFVREERPAGVKKVGLVGPNGGLEEGYGGGRGEAVGRSTAAVSRLGKNAAVKRAALGFRVFEVIACLISFSVMAADKTQGWSGDSFDRYIEYRYSVAINVIGFVYSGFQAFDLGYYLGTGKHVFAHHLRHHFDFAMDQILAYLLMSASSSAATRVDDWISNWGADEFTLMASASIAMSFLAFLAFAFSSLISGYNLCNPDST